VTILRPEAGGASPDDPHGDSTPATDIICGLEGVAHGYPITDDTFQREALQRSTGRIEERFAQAVVGISPYATFMA
jgi:hypothetical protein